MAPTPTRERHETGGGLPSRTPAERQSGRCDRRYSICSDADRDPVVDLGDAVTPRYVVREIHGSWLASDQQIRWDGFNDETCRTPEEAQRRFETRRAWIVDSGFEFATLVA